jgi:hypothetical protein
MAVRVFARIDSRGVKRTFLELTDNDAAKAEALRRSMQQVGFISTDEFMMHERRATSPNPSATLIHRDTGRLTRSLIGQFSFARGSGGTQDSIRRIQIRGDDMRATYGTSVFYAQFHEFGSSIHPKRPFLNPAAEAAAKRGDIEKIFEEEIKRHVRRVQN